MSTATARIAKAIQPHCVLLDSSSFCDAAAAAATAAGLTPDVVVAPEVVVVAGGGDTATTVVVWDSVTVGVDRVGAVTVGVDCVGAVTVGVDRVGAVTVGVDRVGVVRVPPLVSVPPAEPFPPPHAARKPTANNAIIAAAPRRSNDTGTRLVTTHERSQSRATDPSPNRDEPRSCTGAMTILAHTLAADHLVRATCRVRSCDIVGHEAHNRACHGRTFVTTRSLVAWPGRLQWTRSPESRRSTMPDLHPRRIPEFVEPSHVAAGR